MLLFRFWCRSLLKERFHHHDVQAAHYAAVLGNKGLRILPAREGQCARITAVEGYPIRVLGLADLVHSVRAGRHAAAFDEPGMLRIDFLATKVVRHCDESDWRMFLLPFSESATCAADAEPSPADFGDGMRPWVDVPSTNRAHMFRVVPRDQLDREHSPTQQNQQNDCGQETSLRHKHENPNAIVMKRQATPASEAPLRKGLKGNLLDRHLLALGGAGGT